MHPVARSIPPHGGIKFAAGLIARLKLVQGVDRVGG